MQCCLFHHLCCRKTVMSYEQCSLQVQWQCKGERASICALVKGRHIIYSRLRALQTTRTANKSDWTCYCPVLQCVHSGALSRSPTSIVPFLTSKWRMLASFWGDCEDTLALPLQLSLSRDIWNILIYFRMWLSRTVCCDMKIDVQALSTAQVSVVGTNTLFVPLPLISFFRSRIHSSGTKLQNRNAVILATVTLKLSSSNSAIR